MPASKAQRAQAAEKRAKAVKMRIAGLEWDVIAEACGYASRGAACNAVNKALETYTAEMLRDADVLRYQEVARLDRLQAAFWSAALQGDDAAARTVLGCIDRRVRLLGLNAPERHEVITLSAIEAEIATLSAGLGDMPTSDQLRELPTDEESLP